MSRSDWLSVEPTVDRPLRPTHGALAGLVPQESDPSSQRGEAHLWSGWRTGQSPGLSRPAEDSHRQALLLQQNERISLPKEAGGQQQTPLSGEDKREDTRLHRPRGDPETEGFLQTSQPALLPTRRAKLRMALICNLRGTRRLCWHCSSANLLPDGGRRNDSKRAKQSQQCLQTARQHHSRLHSEIPVSICSVWINQSCWHLCMSAMHSLCFWGRCSETVVAVGCGFTPSGESWTAFSVWLTISCSRTRKWRTQGPYTLSPKYSTHFRTQILVMQFLQHIYFLKYLLWTKLFLSSVGSSKKKKSLI